MKSALSDQDLSLLRSASPFAQLNDDDFTLIAGDVRSQTYDRGECLFRQDDPATAFYMILEGWVSLVRDQSDGTRTVIKTVVPGETFAEAMLTPGARYPVSAEAASDLRVVPFETERFRNLIETTPGLSLSIISATFLHLRLLVDQIEHLKSWSIERRLADLLLQMSKLSPDASEFKLPIDQKLIAARLSVTESTLSRTFRKLEPFGVSARRGHVIITNVAALSKFVQGADETGPEDLPASM